MRKHVIAPALLMVAASATQVRAQQCGGADPVGNLGVSLIECDCTIAPATTRTEWQFRTDPRIRRIEAGSAAAGVLQVDDVIISVNGRRLTTAEGARELASLQPNQPVTLMVVRDGVVRTEVLRPTAVCPNDPTLLGAAPAVQRVRVAGAVVEGRPLPTAGARSGAQAGARSAGSASAQGGAGRGGSGSSAAQGAGARVGSSATVQGAGARGGVVTVAPTAAPGYAASRAWIGIAFSCSDCAFRSERAGGAWTFATSPEVYTVEPGSPAYNAGLRRGDVLTHINDVQITSAEGGRRWAQLRPGEQVRLRYLRNGVVRTASFEASPPRGVTALRSSAHLREVEAALARVDTTSYQMDRNARMLQEYYSRLRGQQQLTQEQMQEQMAQLQRYAASQSPEDRRRYEELLQSLARNQQGRNAEQEEQLAQLIRANRVNASQLMATQDSIERAIVTLRALQSSTTGEQRLRYSGTFGSTDIEVRGVSPVIVSETQNEITIRIGDTIVTLKRSRD